MRYQHVLSTGKKRGKRGASEEVQEKKRRKRGDIPLAKRSDTFCIALSQAKSVTPEKLA